MNTESLQPEFRQCITRNGMDFTKNRPEFCSGIDEEEAKQGTEELSRLSLLAELTQTKC